MRFFYTKTKTLTFLSFLPVLLAVVFLSTSCAVSEVRIASTEYYNTQHAWTRHKKVVINMETRVYFYATYKSREFRQAYIDEYARRFQLSPDKKDLLLALELSDGKEYNEFFVSTYMPKRQWNDLNQENSIWKLYLSDGVGKRLEPVEIKKIDLGEDPFYREFYPTIDAWSDGYIIKFPRFDSEGRAVGEGESSLLKLTITGIMGDGTVEWVLRTSETTQTQPTE